MNRRMRRAIAFGKHSGKKQSETNAEIFKEVFLRQLAQQPRNRERKTPPVRVIVADEAAPYPPKGGDPQ